MTYRGRRKDIEVCILSGLYVDQGLCAFIKSVSNVFFSSLKSISDKFLMFATVSNFGVDFLPSFFFEVYFRLVNIFQSLLWAETVQIPIKSIIYEKSETMFQIFEKCHKNYIFVFKV